MAKQGGGRLTKGLGWLSYREMGGLVGRWVAMQGYCWQNRMSGWLSQGDRWLNREMGG